MKKLSILILLVGIALTIGLAIYYRSVVNPVEAELMDINPKGTMISEWPMFVGILTTFVGAVFYYVSHYGKPID